MASSSATSDLVREPLLDDSGAQAPGAPPREGIGLCLSGGGYRAMLFHVGSLWRLNEFGLLGQIQRISSVSGGSITAGVLGLNWNLLQISQQIPVAVPAKFVEAVVAPIRGLADETIDLWAVGLGIITPIETIADEIAGYYRKYLFQDATLQELPDSAGPLFVLNSTNVKSGSLWRFSRPFMGDWQVGLIRNPKISLATAVAASSAFPPFLSPMRLKLNPAAFDPQILPVLTDPTYRSEAVLTDGGVYDNLGLEPVWKNCTTVLVSDGGRRMAPDPSPATDWARHSRRLIDLLEHQTSSLRRRDLISSFQQKLRKGTYWGIQTDIRHYGLTDALSCPFDQTQTLAETETRLAALPAKLQEQLINWGYAVCDAAIRAHLPQPATPPASFPYPQSGL